MVRTVEIVLSLLKLTTEEEGTLINSFKKSTIIIHEEG